MLSETANVELEGSQKAISRMITNFNWRVHLDKFFVHPEEGIEGKDKEVQLIRGVMYYL